MVMRDRSVVNGFMSVASAAALLVALTSSPLRPLHSSLRPLLPGYFRCHLAGVPAYPAFPTRILPISVASRFFPVKALPSGNEEEEPDSTSSRRGLLVLRGVPLALGSRLGEIGFDWNGPIAPSPPMLSSIRFGVFQA